MAGKKIVGQPGSSTFWLERAPHTLPYISVVGAGVDPATSHFSGALGPSFRR